MLDIIIPHYKEEWEIGKKNFDILALQRGVDFADIRVLLVNDGEEYHVADEKLEQYPYRIDQLDIPHGGVSAARNAGMDYSDQDWIMFCDFDDMFTNVFSLKDILSVLPADYDMLYTPFIAEDRTVEGTTWLHLRDDENCVFMHGKVWRRQWLVDHGLRFDTEVHFSEDSEFCAIAYTMLETKRIGRLKTPSPAYMWVYRENSVTTTPGRYVESRYDLFHRHLKVYEAHCEHFPYDRQCGQAARLVMDMYYTLNRPNLPPEFDELKRMTREFYLTHKQEFWDTPMEDLKKIKAVSRSENISRHHVMEAARSGAKLLNDFDESITVTKWLRQLEDDGDEEI